MADLFAKYRCYIMSDNFNTSPCVVNGGGVGGSNPNIKYEDITFSNGVSSNMWVSTMTPKVYIGQVSDDSFKKMFNKVYWDFYPSPSKPELKGKIPDVYAVLQPNHPDTSPLVKMNPDGSNGAIIFSPAEDAVRVATRPDNLDPAIKTAWETAGSFDDSYTGCCWLITYTGGINAGWFKVTQTLPIVILSDAPTEVKKDESFTFNYKIDEGNDYDLLYKIKSLTSNVGRVTIAANRKSATITGTATENIVINGVAVEDTTVLYTVTQTLSHMSSDAPAELEEWEDFTFTYNAEPGYKIQSLTSNIGTVNIETNKKSATITGTATENIVINGVAVEETTPSGWYTVTETLSHMSSDAPIAVEEMKSFLFTYNAEPGYKIQSLDCNIGIVNIPADKKSAIIFGTADRNIVINGVAVEDGTPAPKYTVTETLTHMSSDAPAELEEWEDFTFTYNAEPGYKIQSLTSNTGKITIAPDRKSATLRGYATENIVINGVAVEEDTPINKYVVTETLSHMGSNAPAEVEKNAEFTFNYMAVSGYEIQSLTSNIGTVNIETNKKLATITGTATENIVINGVAVESDTPVVKYTVTENLTHIIASDSNPTTVDKNASFALFYTAESGYIITSLDSTVGKVTFNVNQTSAIVTGTATGNIVVTGVAVKEDTPVVKYTVTENLTHMSSDAPAEVEENEQFTFTYNVEQGFHIQSLTSNIGTVNIETNKKGATITGTATENIVINGVAVEDVTPVTWYTVTENLTHIIASNLNPTRVNENGSFTLSYTAESGYIITSLTSTVGNVTFNADHSSATIEGTATANIVVTGEATYQPNTYNVVVEKEAHIVADPHNPSTIIQGSNYTFRFTTEIGWLISRCTSDHGTVTIAENKKSATVTYNNVSSDIRIVVGSYKDDSYKVVITGTFENSTCNYANGEPISREKNIIITANSGYEFKNTYHYEDEGYTYELVKNLEKTTLTIDTTQITGRSNIILNDNYVATLPVETIGGFCNLYKVTEKELSRLSKVRFQKDSTSDTVVDYGSFITQLYILPLNLPSNIIGDKSNIILGSFDSKVKSTLLNNYTVDYDMGSITVPAKYNNAYDFINTTCTLRVPFFNAVALDPENVVGHTISIKFTLDLYSGNVTMNVMSDFTGGIIYSTTANIVTQIPFIQRQNNSVVNHLSNVFKYVIATPVIEVVRNIPYQADNSTFGRETVQVAKLNTVHGYCEVDKVNLVTLATNDEKDSIISLLKDGVFIN